MLFSAAARRRIAGSLPSKSDAMSLDFALDGRPFAHVAARSDIDLRLLGYADGGVPFLGVS